MKTKNKIIACLTFTFFGAWGQNNNFPSVGNVEVSSNPAVSVTDKLTIYSTGTADHLGIAGTAPAIRLFGGSSNPSGMPSVFTQPYAKIGLATVGTHFVSTAQAGDLIIQNMTKTKSIIFSSNINNSNGEEHMRIDATGDVSVSKGSFYLPAGNLSVGTANNGTAKFELSYAAIPGGSWSRDGIHSYVTQSIPLQNGGSVIPFTAIDGFATAWQANSIQPGMIGIKGRASYGYSNTGGYFEAYGDYETGDNYGVFAMASGHNPSQQGKDWAGYFVGDVSRTGTDNFSSDLKLKRDVKPLTNILEKIMKLKPSSYNFRTDEFKKMNLPSGIQFGLIAQDLELVFPELVTNMSEVKIKNSEGQDELIHPEYKSVKYIELIPILINGVQEQQNLILSQQQQIEELKALVNNLAGNSSKPSGSSTAIPINLSDKNAVVLNQNVPNPFAESTVISYNIPTSFTKAQIIFTTNAGTIIKVIDIKEMGAGSLNVFANDLSNGMYTYSLVIDGKTMDSKKLIKE